MGSRTLGVRMQKKLYFSTFYGHFIDMGNLTRVNHLFRIGGHFSSGQDLAVA